MRVRVQPGSKLCPNIAQGTRQNTPGSLGPRVSTAISSSPSTSTEGGALGSAFVTPNRKSAREKKMGGAGQGGQLRSKCDNNNNNSSTCHTVITCAYACALGNLIGQCTFFFFCNLNIRHTVCLAVRHAGVYWPVPVSAKERHAPAYGQTINNEAASLLRSVGAKYHVACAHGVRN